ncbi:MAG: hypothetical protein A3D13_10560 [Planctomycetes bacterium RIFCSPHIGHO2_02_FULL_40_12]|nr:MAG: hypothetical protein A3D13_10560 [Planctomycetes bacterium RIFCSPHIGHO2_02_FULL_40_12]
MFNIEMTKKSDLKAFYDREYLGSKYANTRRPEEHQFYTELKSFINKFQLHKKKCLEIGCGRGAFQDLVTDYVGVDISDSVKEYFYKPFYQASATKLPFEDNTFDAIWTYAVLEHVHHPEKGLEEMRRVLKDNGILILLAAWQCRPWAAVGLPLRPYRDLDLKGKLTKALIPVRNSVLFRCAYIFPGRLIRSIEFLLSKKPLEFKYKELNPNYTRFWMVDSDAVNSMDPYETILWFLSRGDLCVSYTNWIKRFFVRTGSIIFQIKKL